MSTASSDSNHSGSDMSGVELGFVRHLEKKEVWKLHRCYFPSKVGGKAAWLDPKNLPTIDDMKCDSCGKPLVFLLQVYAPNEDNDDAFHRTLFLFCCKTEACYKLNCNKPFRVFRCQLTQDNEFYDSTPPQYESSTYALSCKEYGNMCCLCGCSGNKLCARCYKISYCSREHQVLDWRRHKLLCDKEEVDSANDETQLLTNILFPENEIVMESEEPHRLSEATQNLASNAQSGKILDGNFSPSELDEFANFDDGDKQFLMFRKAISASGEQVLRYDKGGTPLWCTSENKLQEEKIPKCHCGAPRQFEFQVMPQLLNHLSVQTSLHGPSVDWGILAIYTCSADCSTKERSYEKEYLHKQDFSMAVPVNSDSVVK